jgi:uncharacterized protein YcfL
MKNVLLYCLAMILVLVACNSNKGDQKTEAPSQTTTMDTASTSVTVQPVAEQLYSCSMHPEVTGKKDEACYKCGMKLTVAVKDAATPNKQ